MDLCKLFKRAAFWTLLLLFLTSAVSYAQQSDAQVIEKEKRIKATGAIIQKTLADQKTELDGLAPNRAKIVKSSKYTKNRIAALNYIGMLCNTKAQTADDLSAVSYAIYNDEDVTARALAISYYGLCKSDYDTDKLLAAYVMQGTKLAKAKFIYSTVDPFGILTSLGNGTEEELEKEYILMNGAIKGLVLSKTTLSVTLLEDLNDRYIEDKVLGKLDRKTYEPGSYAGKIQVDILEGIASKIKDYVYRTAEIPYLEKQITVTDDLPTYDVTAKGTATLLLAKMDCNKAVPYADEAGCVKGITKESVTTSLQTIVLSDSWPNDLKLLAYGELKKYYPEQQVFTATGNVNTLVLGQNYQKLLNYALEEEKINKGIMFTVEFVVSWYAGNYIFGLVADGTAAIFGKIFAKMGDEASVAAANEAKIAAEAAKALKKEEELAKDAKWIEEAKQGFHNDTWSGQQYYKEAQKVAEQSPLAVNPDGTPIKDANNIKTAISNLTKTAQKISAQDILTKFKVSDENGLDVLKKMKEKTTLEDLSKMTSEDFEKEYTTAKFSLADTSKEITEQSILEKFFAKTKNKDDFNVLVTMEEKYDLKTISEMSPEEFKKEYETAKELLAKRVDKYDKLAEDDVEKHARNISSKKASKLNKNAENALNKMNCKYTEIDKGFNPYSKPIDPSVKINGYEITPQDLPLTKGTSKPFTTALKHPEMRDLLTDINKSGYKLAIDPSIKGSSTAAYFDYDKKVIGILPSTSWSTFIHEYEHLKFSTAINKLLDLCSANDVSWLDVLEGKSLVKEFAALESDQPILTETAELAKKHGLTSMKELRSNTLVIVDYELLAIDETLAVRRQIELLKSFHYYNPNNAINYVANRQYALKNQISEYKRVIKEYGPNEEMSKAITNAKMEKTLLYSLSSIIGLSVMGPIDLGLIVGGEKLLEKIDAATSDEYDEPSKSTVLYSNDDQTFVILNSNREILIPVDKTYVDAKQKFIVVPPEINDDITVKIPYKSE